MSNLTEYAPPQRGRLSSLWHTLVENPVTIKELRSRMRGRRAFVVLIAYLTVVSLFSGLMYFSYSVSGSSRTSGNEIGQAIFFAMVTLQAFAVIFMAPAFTAGAISNEKERQTFDILRTTLLTARSFVTGKLISALSYIFLIIFSSIPIISVAFILGGVELGEVIILQAVLVISAIGYAMIGLHFSSVMRSTMAASVSTYGVALFFNVALPAVAGISASILAVVLLTGSPPAPVEIGLLYLGMLLVVVNLPLTIVMTEVLLREQNTYWGFWETTGGVSFFVPSPWYLYIIFYGLLAIFLYFRTVKRVSQIAKT